MLVRCFYGCKMEQNLLYINIIHLKLVLKVDYPDIFKINLWFKLIKNYPIILEIKKVKTFHSLCFSGRKEKNL